MNPIETYGPQGEYVAALVEQARRLTDEEVLELAQAWYAARDATRDATRDAAWHAARHAIQDAAWYATRDAIRDAIRDATWDATWNATRDAAAALVVRDQISPDDFTQEHYDILTEPWRRAIGPIHPDDDEVAR
jgi:hypothetical protein